MATTTRTATLNLNAVKTLIASCRTPSRASEMSERVANAAERCRDHRKAAHMWHLSSALNEHRHAIREMLQHDVSGDDSAIHRAATHTISRDRDLRAIGL
jgi:hypothetical protein